MATQFEYDTESLWQKDRDHNIHPWTDFSTFKEEGSMVMANSEGAYVSEEQLDRCMHFMSKLTDSLVDGIAFS